MRTPAVLNWNFKISRENKSFLLQFIVVYRLGEVCMVPTCICVLTLKYTGILCSITYPVTYTCTCMCYFKVIFYILYQFA